MSKDIDVIEEKVEETTINDREDFNNDGIGKFTLTKPVEIDGKEIAEISFDMSGVSVARYEAIKMDIARRKNGFQGQENAEPALNSELCVRFFAEACGISYPELRALPLRDYLTCERIAKVFLLNMLQ